MVLIFSSKLITDKTMQNDTFVIEQIYQASPQIVWRSITSKDEMKRWYFNFKEFVPEVGFAFQFWGGPDENRQYLHLCEITEVIPEKKLAYSWRYDGYEGNTLVSFELFAIGKLTRLKLTHEGWEPFRPAILILPEKVLPKDGTGSLVLRLKSSWIINQNNLKIQSMKRTCCFTTLKRMIIIPATWSSILPLKNKLL